MINFYKNDTGLVMFKDDTYLETDKFVIERPATDDDAVAHPDEHAAFIASITPAPAPAPAPAPEPAAVEPTAAATDPAPGGTV